MLALNKTKAALQGRLSHFSNFTEENNTAISLVNLSRSAGAGNYGKSPQRLTVLQICNSLIAGGMRHWSTPQSPKFSGDLQSTENSADPWLAEKPADRRGWLRLEAQISTKGISSLEQNQRVKWYVLSSAFRFRRRSISACSAAMMNCDVLSSRFLNNSISSTILCGTLACNFWDLELMFVVLTTEFSLVVPITDDTAAERAQPFGSMPRDCSSLRIIRLIQADIDSSPSPFIAIRIACSRSGSTRKAICLLPRGKFVFDMCVTQGLSCLCQTMYNTSQANVKQQRPTVLRTHAGRLTTTIVNVSRQL